MFEREYRDLAFVPRWAIIPTNRTQSVAEHSYYVSLYTLHICEYMCFSSNITADALEYALLHDRDECFLSDIPGPTKRSIRDKEKYDQYVCKETLRRFGSRTIGGENYDLVKKVIKVADLMDEVGFWYEQKFMGNDHHKVMLPECTDRLLKACHKLDENGGFKLYSEFMSQITKPKLPPRENSDVAA